MSLLSASYLLMMLSVACSLTVLLADPTGPTGRLVGAMLVVVSMLAVVASAATGAVYFAGRMP